MNRQEIIEKTLQALEQLSEEKALEVSEFAEFLIQRQDEMLLRRGIATLVSEGDAFQFLENEDDLYSESDLKEVFNA